MKTGNIIARFAKVHNKKAKNGLVPMEIAKGIPALNSTNGAALNNIDHNRTFILSFGIQSSPLL